MGCLTNYLSTSKSPYWLRENLLHLLQGFSLGLRQGEEEPDDGKEGEAGINVVRTKVNSLDQVEESVGYKDIESPVKPCGEADSCTSEPEGINLKIG